MRGIPQIAIALSIPWWICACGPETGTDFTTKLETKIRRADRIVIYRIDEDKSSDEKPSAYESSDKSKIRDLFTTIDLNERLLPYCKCYGEIRMELFDGNSTIAEMSLHHGSCIRWHNSPFQEQAKMTDESRKQFQAWLAIHIDGGSNSDE